MQQALLLAVWLLLSAQTQSAVTSLLATASTRPTALGDVTKTLLSAARQSLEGAQQQPSVVQDWSLVCQELCGAAGLGASEAPGDNASTILSSTFESSLSTGGKLCDLQLGNVNCNSSDDAYGQSISMANKLCGSFCQQRHGTLTGCSPCQLASVIDSSGGQSIATHGSELTDGDEEAVDDADDATPDWDELCKGLCKTGDGGSLCNCDLTPFFN